MFVSQTIFWFWGQRKELKTETVATNLGAANNLAPKNLPTKLASYEEGKASNFLHKFLYGSKKEIEV